jgi:PIN domain nuclease of toxin-antitoxin system
VGEIRDPFDRLIVSAARHLRAALLTRDSRLEWSGLVETIWSW